MSVLMLKRPGLSIGDAVRVDWSEGEYLYTNYGHVRSEPYTDIDADGSVTLIDVTWRDGTEGCILPGDIVTRTSGCECGNPWTLCHPDA